MSKVSPYIVLILILGIAFLIRYIFFVGINFNDDLAYVNYAHDVIQGDFKPNQHILATRIMLIYPIAMFFALFGAGDVSASLYILLTSLGSIVVAFLLGKLLFNAATGITAAFLLVFFPLEAAYATTIVPDVPLAFFLGLSVLLFLYGDKKDNKTLCFLAGATVGLAWLIKSLALLIGLFFLCSLILANIQNKEQRWHTNKKYIALLGGVLLILMLEGLFYLSIGESFTTRFIIENKVYSPALLGTNTDLSYYPRVLLNMPNQGKYFRFFGFFFYAALASIAYIIFKAKKEAYILLIWFIPLLLFLQYGTMNVAQYVLIHKLWRFLMILSLPTVLLTAYLLVNNKLKTKKIVMGITLTFLLVTSVIHSYNATTYMNKAASDIKGVALFFKTAEKKDLYSDEITTGYLNFLLGYRYEDKLKKLNNIKSPDEIQDAYVVVDSERTYVEVPEFKSKLPEFIWSPPKEWELIKVLQESDIDYYATYDTKIYYAPKPL